MPIEVRAFACKWGCQRNVLTGRKRMERHEEVCNWNPAQRACITCAHFIPAVNPARHDPDDPGESCGCEEGEDIAEKLRNGCPLWAAGGGGEMCVGSGEKQPNDKIRCGDRAEKPSNES